MAKNPENIKEFLGELKDKLQRLWAKERQTMLDLKKREAEEYGFEYDGKINKEDFWYYANQIELEDYQVDHKKLKEYFPLETVINGMLKIYQTLLSLEFTKIENPEVWHEDVSLHMVADSRTGENLGYFFMDLHPRDGKYGHAAMWDLQTVNIRRQRALSNEIFKF